jgi:hemerythrin
MSKIVWDGSLTVGVEELDTQHKKLIAIINDLDSAMIQGHGKDVLGEVITELIEYVKIHFGAEEGYLRKARYPDFGAHQDQHTAFIQKISSFKSDYEAGKAGLSVEIMAFLKVWIIQHIKSSDKKYISILNDAGFC